MAKEVCGSHSASDVAFVSSFSRGVQQSRSNIHRILRCIPSSHGSLQTPLHTLRNTTIWLSFRADFCKTCFHVAYVCNQICGELALSEEQVSGEQVGALGLCCNYLIPHPTPALVWRPLLFRCRACAEYPLSSWNFRGALWILRLY